MYLGIKCVSVCRVGGGDKVENGIEGKEGQRLHSVRKMDVAIQVQSRRGNIDEEEEEDGKRGKMIGERWVRGRQRERER